MRWCGRASIQPKEERAVAALDAMGLSVSDAIRLLMLRIADEQRLSFDVKVPTPATIKAMKELDAGGGQRFDPPENSFPIWTSEHVGAHSVIPFRQGRETGQETGQGHGEATQGAYDAGLRGCLAPGIP